MIKISPQGPKYGLCCGDKPPACGFVQEEASKTMRWDNWRTTAQKGGLLSPVPHGYKGPVLR